ncbi:MAG: hypothetical protein V4713_18920 [Pseudomonadota bacterium]
MALQHIQSNRTTAISRSRTAGTTPRQKIAQIRMNKAGTVTFDGRFIGMTEGEDFHVQQLSPGQKTDQVGVHSSSFTGWITKAGAVHLLSAKKTDSSATYLLDLICAEELFLLKSWVSCAGRPAPSVNHHIASTAAQ